MFPVNIARSVIGELKQQFQDRFADLDSYKAKIRVFENPFDCGEPATLSVDLQMEIIELQSNETLKDKYKNENIIDFYKCLPEDYHNLKRLARGLLSVFGTTYLCEKTFSKMK